MAFDAGAIVGKLQLDKNQWNSAVSSVTKDQEKMKSGFSSMCRDWKENWLATTAAIYGGMKVVSTAWDLIARGTQAEQVEDGFNAIARSAGIAGDNLRRAMLEASAFTVSFSNIASSASALIGNSLKTDQIVTLMQIARVEARKTGEDVQTAFNTIAGAVTGGFTRALRTAYGLNIDVTVAIENYARATGLTKEQVERFYKSQAIANEIIKQTANDLKVLTSTGLTHFEQVQRMKVAWQDFLEKLGLWLFDIATIVGSVVGIIGSSFANLYDRIAQGIYKLLSLIPGLKQQMSEIANMFGAKADANVQAMQYYWQEITASMRNIAGQTKKDITDMAAFNTQAVDESVRYIKQTYDEWLSSTRQNFNAMVDLGQGAFTSLQSGISDLGMSIIGLGDDIKDVFKNLGNSIIKMLMDIAAKWITMQVIMGVTKAVGSIGGMFGGAANAGTSNIAGNSFATAGLSLGGFATGIDEVPSTGFYKLHAGEQVVPKYDAGKGQVIELTIENNITPSFVNAAIASEPGTVKNIISADTMQNGQSRRTQRVYGK